MDLFQASAEGVPLVVNSAVVYSGYRNTVLYYIWKDERGRNMELSDKLVIRHAPPSVEQYLALRAEAGLGPFSAEGAAIGLPRSSFAVTLYEDDLLIGMGRVIGDGGCFFQVTDIAVKPAYQGRGLGKIIMREITAFLDTLPDKAYTSLIADGEASQLYAQFGFAPVMPKSQGMALKR
jgi:ribosomal protein S18 acetylase RimI-like enzyme